MRNAAVNCISEIIEMDPQMISETIKLLKECARTTFGISRNRLSGIRVENHQNGSGNDVKGIRTVEGMCKDRH